MRIKLFKVMTTVLFAIGLLNAPSAFADEVHLGGIDFDRYCSTKYTLASASLPWGWARINTNPYSWKCVGPSWLMIAPTVKAGGPNMQNTLVGEKGVDFNEACRMQYGDDAFAVVGKEKDPYSWQCRKNVFPESQPPANVG